MRCGDGDGACSWTWEVEVEGLLRDAGEVVGAGIVGVDPDAGDGEKGG